MTTTLTPYLGFDGNTREVFAFYAGALGAAIQTMMSYDDMPAAPQAAAAEHADRPDVTAVAQDAPAASAPQPGCGDGPPPSGPGIMHASLLLPGGARLFAGDTPPGMPHRGNQGVMLALEYATVDLAHSAFHALQAGGQVTMPMAPSFWARTFGMLTDRFGVSWAISGEPVAF